MQIRTVLKGRASQTSVGSGFFVARNGLIITNFHVISQAALEAAAARPGLRHRRRPRGAAGIVQIDVLHDLALLKAGDAATRSFDALEFRPESRALAQGERIYSLGNPLDVGFAVMEGTYNGLVRRSFYPQIFFGGALSAGMSGGPALDQDGQVIGINVARRVDGEQVSFLVPASFAAALLSSRAGCAAAGHARPSGARRAADGAPGGAGGSLHLARAGRPRRMPRYQVPVPPDEFMRCWGSSEASRTGGMDLERSDCVMDTRIFAGDFSTGAISVRHESYDGTKLGAMRFAARHSASFRNESFVRLRAELQTRPECQERFIDRQGLVLRAVVCLRAYKKLPQLYDLSILVATLDQATAGVQGRFDAQGVSFANAQRLTRHYLGAYAWAK